MSGNEYHYYSDLSSTNEQSSSDADQDDYDEDDDDEMWFHRKATKAKLGFSPRRPQQQDDSDNPLSLTIFHLDVDCFYCQCEHLDRNLPTSRPLAIGQKHIIVTSNYAARKFGVKKLQSREAAYKACPNLLIVEGSDLERYRNHGRKIYESFRQGLLQIYHHHHQKQQKQQTGNSFPPPTIRRGRGMDEMQADISSLANELLPKGGAPHKLTHRQTERDTIYIYGDQTTLTTLTEDQTGAEAVVRPYNKSIERPTSLCEGQDRLQCQDRLVRVAQHIIPTLQAYILQETGFTTTLGVSTNPLLAKLASDLQKPHSINVLYPWRGPSLIAPMPLRKIPDAGHKTIKLLKPALEAVHGPKDFWTCQDLLDLPKTTILTRLQSEEHCDMILQRCRGMDTTIIEDDGGQAPKTVSCENSFRRGTVVTPRAVWEGLEDLYVRLPRLLLNRREWSQNPSLAYPTTIKLTARVVDIEMQLKKSKRRPFVTHSKQVPFYRGQAIMDEPDPVQQAKMVQEAVRPLVQSLVLHSPDPGGLNVTRLNIAVTNFKDIVEMASPNSPSQRRSSAGVVAAFAHQRGKIQTTPGSEALTLSQGRKSSPMVSKRKTPSPTTSMPEGTLPPGIDPDTLAELPSEMVQQILCEYRTIVGMSQTQPAPLPKRKVSKIDDYFSRRK